MIEDEVIIQTERVEVKLLKPVSVIKETLSRIGIANRTSKKLFQSCHVIVVEEKNYICHFKELLRVPRMTEVDLKRRNTIIWLLTKWNLISVDSNILVTLKENIQQKKVYILSKVQCVTENWEIIAKYHDKQIVRGGE